MSEARAQRSGFGPANLRLFDSPMGSHVFMVDGSRVFDIDGATRDAIRETLANSECDDAAPWMDALRVAQQPRITTTPMDVPEVRSISLNVAQSCNMSCGYCYADEGLFGGRARRMPIEVARRTVDQLFDGAGPNARLVVGFMGGEPLIARRVVHDAARYAWARAQREGRAISFSITTNATLIQPEDGELFQDLPFTVTISVDGTRSVHEAVRIMRDGSSSYNRLQAGLKQLTTGGRPQQLSARATVTPRSEQLLPQLRALVDLGFDDVGFSPVLVSPIPSLAFDKSHFLTFLDHMVECGEYALSHLKQGEPYPFSNLNTALLEIHRGTHRPFPCGAGAAYLSANAEGDLFACHRFIDDPSRAMGNVFTGVDQARRQSHLASSHVDMMEPCKSCWARYLCGGGCYHEVQARGRISCDYIRGWLEFCLSAYVQLEGKT